MKTALSIVLAATALTGCAVVPVPVGPRVYAAPPPVVVVRPAPFDYGPRWHRHRYY